jgi:hypothetical protein
MFLSILTPIALLIPHIAASPADPTSPSTPATIAGAKILTLMKESAAGKLAKDSDLDTLFEDLEPILFPAVFGTYAGGLFCGPCKSDMNRAGKHFVNATYANPLLVYPSATDRSVVIKHPRENIAKIEERTAFGKEQAAVVYWRNGVVNFLRVVVNDEVNGLVLIGKGTMGGRWRQVRRILL